MLEYITHELPCPDEDLKNAALLAKSCGFDSFDFITDVKCDNYIDKAKSFREFFDKNGLKVHQTHAPFNRYNKYGTDDEFRKYLSRAEEVTKILGAKNIVFHVDEYKMKDGEKWDFEKMCAWHKEYMNPFVYQAKKLDINVCIENLFDDRFWGTDERSRFSCDIEEILWFIKSFNADHVKACWDFGHGEIQFWGETFNNFKKVFPYIACTHVHDNFAGYDMHLPPTLGQNDWKKYIDYMKENNYQGVFSLELGHGKVPNEFMPDFLKLAYKMTNYVLSL